MSDNIESRYDYFLQLLQDKKNALEMVEETHKASSETVVLDQSRVGRLSRMDALQGQAMSKATEQRRELELKKIDAAIARIESGDYGYCLRCGEDINPKRLEVDPAATLCINCAE